VVGTIESYPTVGAFCDYLTADGRDDTHTAISYQAVEPYLAD
jgi:hypothetical protein